MDRENLGNALGYSILIFMCYYMGVPFGFFGSVIILFCGFFWLGKSAKGKGIGIAQDMMGKPGTQRIELVHIKK